VASQKFVRFAHSCTPGHAHWRPLFLLMAMLAAFRERLLATIENRKLEQRGGLRLLNGVGFHVLGRTPQGEFSRQWPVSPLGRVW